MSKTRDTGFLGNVVKYDANGNINLVNGATTLLSVSSSGQLTVPGDEVITGSLTVLGGITGAITGSATSASYAANTSLLNNSGSGEFVPTGSFNTFSSSVLTYTGSVNSQLSALQTTSGSNITRISALESASGSAITRLSALEVTSGSNITRLSSLEARTGSYATTGSNTFDGGQYFSSSFNPTGFSTTASLYTDGGLRVSKDAYVSGTLYLNNLTVFGTQSVSYISSSQLNIGTNLITVNTDTPSIRFGGLAVYDSGSTGLTGSILWDSQNNHWVYTNPSGSSYSGGMFISGPRASSLGSETGTTSCMLMAGQGGDHITSSMIYHSSTVTCIPNTLAGGVGCFSGAVCTLNASVSSCLGVGVASPQGNFEVAGLSYFTRSSNSLLVNPNYGGAGTHTQLQVVCNMALAFATCGDNERMRITSDGVVGIGTNAPVIQDGNLVVAGCVGTGQGTANTVAQINIWEITSGNKSGLWFGSMTNANTGVIGSRTATGNIAFQTYCGAWAERMRIDYTGNVGIGTATPSYKLDVNGTGRYIGSLTINEDGGGTKVLTVRSDWAGVEPAINVTTNNCLLLMTNNTVRVCLSNTGIATFACQVCAPSFISCLNVNNGHTALLICNPNPGSNAFSQISIFNNTTNQAGFFYNSSTRSVDGGVCSFSMYNDSATGNIRIRTGNNIVLATGASSTDRLTIAANGISTFTCQVCISISRTNGADSTALVFQDNTTGVQTPGFGLRLAYQSNGTGVQSVIGLENGGTGTNNESQISFYTQNVAGGLAKRLLLTSGGDAGFSGNVCAASFSASNPSLTRSNLNIDRATKVITSFNATASGARWLRVGCFNARTTYLMSFGTTGNYYTPGSTTFLMFRDWGNGFFTSTLGKLGEQYVFCTRFQSDNVGDTYALEVWMNSITADQLNGVLVYSAATLAGNPDSILMCLGSYGTSLANAANTSTAILL